MRVRSAGPSDTPAVLELLEAMHAENGMAALNREKVRALVERLIGGDGLVLIAERGGTALGTVGLEPARWWYSDEWFLKDWWTFVAPEGRRTRAAVMLIRAADRTARRAGLPLLMGVLSPKEPERKMRLFGRLLEPVGGMFRGG